MLRMTHPNMANSRPVEVHQESVTGDIKYRDYFFLAYTGKVSGTEELVNELGEA